ncbi:MAG TPA: hypothetical protein VFX59_10845 [Polyangiales bacterium]|nr:hypothetical protein [Polyangiales bacterium]
MAQLDRVTLERFVRWKTGRAHGWQLADFREHSIDLGHAKARRRLSDWSRDFNTLTRDDHRTFDADGGGAFRVTAAGRRFLRSSEAAGAQR